MTGYRVQRWPASDHGTDHRVTVVFESGEAFHGIHARSFELAVEQVIRAVEDAGGPAALKAKWRQS